MEPGLPDDSCQPRLEPRHFTGKTGRVHYIIVPAKTTIMILKITGRLTVSDLQDKFSECYPGLDLRFYHDHKALENDEPVAGNTLVDELLKKYDLDELHIMSWEKAGKLAQDFKEHFGLLVRVFRTKEDKSSPLEEDEQLVAGASHHVL